MSLNYRISSYQDIDEQCREIEENDRRGKIRDLFKKIGDIAGRFHGWMGTIKDRNNKDLIEAKAMARIHRRSLQKRSL